MRKEFVDFDSESWSEEDMDKYLDMAKELFFKYEVNENDLSVKAGSILAMNGVVLTLIGSLVLLNTVEKSIVIIILSSMSCLAVSSFLLMFSMIPRSVGLFLPRDFKIQKDADKVDHVRYNASISLRRFRIFRQKISYYKVGMFFNLSSIMLLIFAFASHLI